MRAPNSPSSFRRTRHAFDSRFAGVADAGIQGSRSGQHCLCIVIEYVTKYGKNWRCVVAAFWIPASAGMTG